MAEKWEETLLTNEQRHWDNNFSESLMLQARTTWDIAFEAGTKSKYDEVCIVKIYVCG